MSELGAELTIKVFVPTIDPALEDPHEIARYFLDHDCDDPVWEFVSAEWDR